MEKLTLKDRNLVIGHIMNYLIIRDKNGLSLSICSALAFVSKHKISTADALFFYDFPFMGLSSSYWWAVRDLIVGFCI